MSRIRKPKLKLKQMIVLLFSFLSVVPLCVLGITNMQYHNDKLERLLMNDLQVAVSTQVHAIDNFFEERAIDSAIIIGYQIVAKLLRAERDAVSDEVRELQYEVNDLLHSRIGNNRFVDSVTIIDEDFYIRACSVAHAVGKRSVVQYFDINDLGRGMRFTDVVTTNWSGEERRVVTAIQPIWDPDTDEKLGYVIQELNLRFFEDMRVSTPVFNNGTVYLIDSKGQMIAAGDSVSSRQDYVLTEEERADFLSAWQARDEDSQSGLLFYHVGGDRYMSCYSYFTHTDWHVISSVNMDEVLQTREGYRDLALLIALVLSLLAISAHLVVSYCVAGPIDGMIEKFRRITDTKDYSIRMEEFGRNEIGAIARGINDLLASIEAYIRLEHEKQAELAKKAERDPLTGLLNKESIAGEICRRLPEGPEKRAACLFVDVDDFKGFNTKYGHIGGDRVLCFVADALSYFAQGLAGRQGGDEFVAFIEDAPDAHSLASKIQALLDNLNTGIVLEKDGACVPIRCSIGAALVQGPLQYERLLSLADEAMYYIKNDNGKNGFSIVEYPDKECAGL